jgi:hypothetical protein
MSFPQLASPTRGLDYGGYTANFLQFSLLTFIPDGWLAKLRGVQWSRLKVRDPRN